MLTPDDNRVFVDGFDVYERECAEAICRWVDLPIDALDGTWPFHCRLPGHGPDHDPSATWLKTPSGYYLYKDWHPRSRHGLYTIPEVFAALTSRVLKQLPDPSRMAWRLRLMVEEGWLEPEPVRMKPVPEEASDLLRRYCEGFRFLVMCKSCHPKTTPGAATPFARAFAAHWCGIPKGSIWTLQQEATDAIVQALADAKRTILVQAYSFTSAPIAKALLDAHTRGVQVHVILDKSQRTEKYSSADFLANQGVPTMIDAEHAIAHNKVILIDGELVLTGSFNFTKAAQEKNAENLLIIRDPALAAQYTKNWEAHRQHSQSYVGRGVRP